MNRIATTAEWNTEDLPPDRLQYLEGGYSFEDITNLISEGARVVSVQVRPFETFADSNEKTARQVVFRCRVVGRICDLFFNSRDGLRGRYWQSPKIGSDANAALIHALLPKLIAATGEMTVHYARGAAEMNEADISKSLTATSSKIWPCEFDEQGLRSLPIGDRSLRIARWITNESRKPTRWRWAPNDRDLEVKGALIDVHGKEHIPESKKDRAEQIYLYGFT